MKEGKNKRKKNEEGAGLKERFEGQRQRGVEGKKKKKDKEVDGKDYEGVVGDL